MVTEIVWSFVDKMYLIPVFHWILDQRNVCILTVQCESDYSISIYKSRYFTDDVVNVASKDMQLHVLYH